MPLQHLHLSLHEPLNLCDDCAHAQALTAVHAFNPGTPTAAFLRTPSAIYAVGVREMHIAPHVCAHGHDGHDVGPGHSERPQAADASRPPLALHLPTRMYRRTEKLAIGMTLCTFD